MNNYFDLIPKELINIILVYLNKDDLEKLDELFIINYETLFSIRYNELYTLMKQIIRIDLSLKGDWKDLYEDLETLDYHDILMILSGKEHIDDRRYTTSLDLDILVFIRSSTFNMIFSSFILNIANTSFSPLRRRKGPNRSPPSNLRLRRLSKCISFQKVF